MTIEQERTQQFIQSLHGIVYGRWFLIIGLGFLSLLQKILGIVFVSLSLEAWLLLGLVSIIHNIWCALYIRRPTEKLRLQQLRRIGLAQIIIDQCILTLVIYVTGGVEGIGYLLYFFPILSATILFSDLIIIGLSVSIVFFYSLMITFEYMEVIPHFHRYVTEGHIFRNAEITVTNTVLVDLLLLLLSLFAVYVNRIIQDRELQSTVEREKVQSILSSLEDGIVMIDADKHLILLNPPARDLLGVYDDVRTELRVEDFPAHFSRLVELIRSEETTKRLGQEVVIEDGLSKIFIQVDSIPIFASDGSVASWVKVLRDITREREIDEIKSDFISIAAHQLRTPLAALKWFFKIMADGDAGPITMQQKDLLGKAYQRSTEVIDIVNNLLDISEIEEGRFPYEFAEESMTQLLESVVKNSQVDSERKKVKLVFQKDEHLPPIEMDKTKMRMAIQNLVDNAVKYSKENTAVTINAAVKDNRCFISVSDSGIGIAKEEQPKIFSKFFRGKNAKEKETTGSGLGLYIVKNVVQKHRGRIWFESKINVGTTFFVSLPIPRSSVIKKKR